ncbi:hypothetical protein ACP6EK_07405 [Candidatus Caldatribacterium sp. SIUC1]|uniref:hypothetical protein n=1 Tax=Candidatus Caldatribacterium sp. SIUC1 TaxID=3418365 RepID=UPI003F6929B1
MEKGTCAFEDWLGKIQEEAAKRNFLDALRTIAEKILERYGARIWFAEILGKRWSYITGCGGEDPLPLRQIPLTPRFGLVVEKWECIPPLEGEAILTFLREFLAQTGTSSVKSEG